MADEESQISNDQAGSSKGPGLSGDAKSDATAGVPASEKAARIDAAKAFYRAMYAGEEVAPSGFGLMEKEKDARGETCPNCNRLDAEATEARQKASEWENLYKRMAADFENYRKRLDREREEFLVLGIQKAVEVLLPALDDLDRAKAALSDVCDPKSVIESFNVVHNRFVSCLDRLGVQPLPAENEPFDPKYHQAVQEVETTNKPDGTVIQELRRGYAINDKVIRPALVSVSAHTGAKGEPGKHNGSQQVVGKPEQETQKGDAACATGNESSSEEG